MQKGFQKILVPVYSSLQYQGAIHRAMEWSYADEAEIKIVEIDPLCQFKAKLFNQAERTDVEGKRIEEIQRDINGKVTVTYYGKSTGGESLQALIKQEQFDLVVLPAKSLWWPFTHIGSALKLAASTGIPVLKLKRKVSSTTSIVVPIQQGLPGATLEKISMISKQNLVEIHLVSYKKQDAGEESDTPLAMLQVYQWLKSYVKCPVQFSLVNGASETKAVYNYVHQLDNDVLLLQ